MARAIASICCSPPDFLVQSLFQARESFGNLIDHATHLAAVFTGRDPQLQVLAHRQAGHDASLFGHVSQARMKARVRRLAEQLGTVEHHAATALGDQANHRTQGGGFARAIAAHQCDDFTSTHLQAHVLHHMAAVVPSVQFVDLEHAQPSPR
jgi:hypothetical protein